jgi:hypothetical protein
VAGIGGANTGDLDDGPLFGKGYAVGGGLMGVFHFGTAFAFAPEITVSYRTPGKGRAVYLDDSALDSSGLPTRMVQEGTFSEVGLDIPLMVRLSFQVIPVWLELGPQLGFAFNAKVAKAVEDGGDGLEKTFKRELFDFGGAVGLGVRIQNKYEVTVRASRYITDYIDGRNWALWQAQIGLAYLF